MDSLLIAAIKIHIANVFYVIFNALTSLSCVFKVLMGFLVGNDFIPHLPDLHINKGALPILYRTYIEVLPTLGGELIHPYCSRVCFVCNVTVFRFFKL